jgi:hypothetical protein
MIGRRPWLVVLLSCWLGQTTAARAQDVDPHWTPGPWGTDRSDGDVASTRTKPRPGPLGLRLDLAYTSRADELSTITALSPLLSARYRWHRHWAVGVEWGMAFAYESAGGANSEGEVGTGNPLLSAAHSLLADEQRHLDVWVGATLPLAWLDAGLERGFSRATYAYALAARGLWNPWLWAPESLGAASGGSYVTAVSRELSIVIEGALGVTLPLSDVTQDVADLYVQVASCAELGAGMLRLGLRVQAVAMTSDIDALQTALAPYAYLDVAAWSFGARFLLNVDEPLGFSGAGIDAWGLSLLMEGSL